MTGRPLRILYLEDSDEDAELVSFVLTERLDPCTILRAADRASFELGLRDETVNLVLSDDSMPFFDGQAALALTKVLRPELPFVLCSGTADEARIRGYLAQGADGCAPKHQLRSLPGILKAITDRIGQPH